MFLPIFIKRSITETIVGLYRSHKAKAKSQMPIIEMFNTLESFRFQPPDRRGEPPRFRPIYPEVGVWHTVKLTMRGRTFSAEYDGEVIHDNFVYHDWMLNMEPAPIRLQKHIVVHGDNLGKENPCPIEYRNIFIIQSWYSKLSWRTSPSYSAENVRPLIVSLTVCQTPTLGSICLT